MDKPKPLPSSLRDKKRYIVFSILSKATINPDAMAEKIYEAGMELLGEAGMAKSRMWVMKNMFSPARKIGMIRCLPGYVEECRLVLSSVSHIEEAECILKVEGVTGTIRTAKLKYYGD